MTLDIPFRVIVCPPTPEDFEAVRRRVDEYRARFSEHDLFRFSADPKPSLADIGKAVKRFQSDIGREYCIVFIDLLSMVKEFANVREGANFAQNVEVAMNSLHAIAKELHFHWIGTVQLNRTVETDKINSLEDLKKTRPMRAAIKNSNAYLERARTTISLWRPMFFALECLLPEEYDGMVDLIHFQVLKSNNNAIQERKALFVPDTFSVVPVEDDLPKEE
jgi:replicative DNA helicase